MAKKKHTELSGEDAYTPLKAQRSVVKPKPVKASQSRRTQIVDTPPAVPSLGVKRDPSRVNDEFLQRAMDKLGHDPKCSRRKVLDHYAVNFEFDTENCARCRKIARTIPKGK